MAERRYTLPLYAALIVAAGATYGVYRVLEAAKANNRVETRPVVVAALDIPEGSGIERPSVSVNQWPAQTVPAGSFADVDSVLGRVTRVSVFKGEPIVPGRLAPQGTGSGLEVKIVPGKRAMAVRIDDFVGLSGLIQPNSRVDVLVTIRDDSSPTEKQVSKLFMENMRVLSVGTQVQRGADGKPISATTAALEVTPEETERLAIAMRQGSIQLVLRGYGDPDSINTRGATSNDVLAQLRDGRVVEVPRPRPVASRSAPRPAPPPMILAPVAVYKPPDSLTVQVYRAGKLSQHRFEKTDSTEKGTPPPR